MPPAQHCGSVTAILWTAWLCSPGALLDIGLDRLADVDVSQGELEPKHDVVRPVRVPARSSVLPLPLLLLLLPAPSARVSAKTGPRHRCAGFAAAV